MLGLSKDSCVRLLEHPEEHRPGPEFLVVCADNSVFKVLSLAIRCVKGRLNCAPTATSAHDYVVRRRVDGIVVDMNVPGAAELIQSIRATDCTRTSVIFACMGALPDGARSAAGTNFLIHPPFVSSKIAQMFNMAAPLMRADKRRFYRRAVMVPVTLRLGARKLGSTTKNLSEGGMTLWSLEFYMPGSQLEFVLDIPYAGTIRGGGEIVWNKRQGLAGVKFNILPNESYSDLSGWINQESLKRAS
jgi:hypothetical protein